MIHKIGRLDSRIDRSRFQHTRLDELAITIRCVHARVTPNASRYDAATSKNCRPNCRKVLVHARSTRTAGRHARVYACAHAMRPSARYQYPYWRVTALFSTVTSLSRRAGSFGIDITTRCLTLIGTQINLARETATRTHNLHRMQITTFRRDATRSAESSEPIGTR